MAHKDCALDLCTAIDTKKIKKFASIMNDFRHLPHRDCMAQTKDFFPYQTELQTQI